MSQTPSPVVLAEIQAKLSGASVREFVKYTRGRLGRELGATYEADMSMLPGGIPGAIEPAVAAYCLLAVTPTFWTMDAAKLFTATTGQIAKVFEQHGVQYTPDHQFYFFQAVVHRVASLIDHDAAIRKASGLGPWWRFGT